MKRTTVWFKLLTLALVGILMMTALASCGGGGTGDGEQKIDKDEVPEGTVKWQFVSVENVDVESDDANERKMESYLASVLAEEYYIVALNAQNKQTTFYDYMETKDGDVTFYDYKGIGTPEDKNGVKVYTQYNTDSIEMGTYTGSDIGFTEEIYTEVYVKDGRLIVHVEKLIKEGTTYIYDVIFERQ